MKLSEVLMVSTFAIGLGLGNILFKLSARRQLLTSNSDWARRILFLFCDWTFLLGVALYGFMTLYWIWLLTFVPLSRAYPFTLLSLLVAGIGGVFLFREPLTIRYVIGLSIIGFGLLVLGKE